MEELSYKPSVKDIMDKYYEIVTEMFRDKYSVFYVWSRKKKSVTSPGGFGLRKKTKDLSASEREERGHALLCFSQIQVQSFPIQFFYPPFFLWWTSVNGQNWKGWEKSGEKALLSVIDFDNTINLSSLIG